METHLGWKSEPFKWVVIRLIVATWANGASSAHCRQATVSGRSKHKGHTGRSPAGPVILTRG